MDGTHDGDAVAASLADWLAGLAFTDRAAPAVAALLVDSVAAWGAVQGWRVYRRAPSVVPLPPPLAHQHSVLDVGCARPVGAPVVVEVDHLNRRRTVEKLLAEAAAGRVAIWVRWGTRDFEPPPEPVRMVICQVVARRGVADRALSYSRVAAADRSAPEHSAAITGGQPALFDDGETAV